MQPYAAFFLGAALTAGLQPACAQSGPETARPQFQLLDTNSVSLGTLTGFDVKFVNFRFKNTSTKTATLVALVPSCACVKGMADKMQTPPGEEMTVTLIFDPATVHGNFQRELWLNFDDPAQWRVTLSVDGEVVPLFTGLPSEPLTLQSDTAQTVWTNRYTLRSSQAGIRPGAPQVETNANLQTVATLTANASDKAAYDLTLTVTPLAPGRHFASVLLPVEGGREMPPVRLDIRARVGQALAVSPSQADLYASRTPVLRRFLIRTDAADVNPGALTWEPHLPGVEVEVQSAKRSANLLATVRFTPDALKRLRADKESRLLFHYPKHTSAAVRLIAAEGAAPGAE